MSDKPITIIIPTLNEVENLSLLLPYLKKYKSSAREIIVADAFKTDDHTKDICNQHEVIRVECNQGSIASQMNNGASIAKGDILYFVHADARPPERFENNIRETLSEGYDFGIFSYSFDSDRSLLGINSNLPSAKGGLQEVEINRYL